MLTGAFGGVVGTIIFADLVYTCRFSDGGQTIQVALLLEHKSYPEKHPHFQLLRYLLNAWQQAEQQKEPLLPIIPVIIYHGEARWNYAPLQSYFGLISEILQPYIPEFRYELIDLTQYSEEQIIRFQNAFLALATLLMRVRQIDRFLKYNTTTIARLLRLIEQQNDFNYLRTTFIYVYENANLPLQEIVTIFERVSSATGNVAMTTADQIRYENTFSHIRGLLSIGLTADKIAEAFKMSLREVEEIVQKIRSEKEQPSA